MIRSPAGFDGGDRIKRYLDYYQPSYGVMMLSAGQFSPAALFAQGEQGVWYDPSDFSTLFQNAAGTTPVTAVEQPVGLMLDKSKGLVLGPELIGSTDLTTWSAQGGAVISGSTFTTSTNSGVSKAFFTVGNWYRITGNISFTAGSFTLVNAVSGITPLITSVQNGVDFSILYYATNTSLYLRSGTSVATTVTVNSLSIRELPGNHATQSSDLAARPVLSARVNLLTKTEQFNDAVWVNSNATITANAVVAPDGTMTADKLVASATTTLHETRQAETGKFVAGSTVTKSVYAKAGEWNFIGLWSGSSQARRCFNLTTGESTGYGLTSTANATNVGNGWWLVTMTWTQTVVDNFRISVMNSQADPITVYTGDGTSGIYIWGADLRVSNVGVNLPAYQRVNTSTDYDTTGFPYYLRFDGSDDSMATATINPGSVDKAQVFAGVRKLSDAAQGVVAEWSADIASNNGTFLLAAPDGATATFGFDSKGTAQVDAVASSLTAPLTRVVTGLGDISGDTATIRINGVQADQDTGDQGTGNYLSYPLYIGSRAGTSLRFNGQLYSLIARFSATNLPDATIAQTEAWVNGKTGAY